MKGTTEKTIESNREEKDPHFNRKMTGEEIYIHLAIPCHPPPIHPSPMGAKENKILRGGEKKTKSVWRRNGI